MARDKSTLENIDKSNLTDYPNGRIKNNTGAGDGTPVNEFVYGDIHETLAKLMRLYDISYNGLPDNETNGYQLVSALQALASKNDYVLDMSSAGGVLQIPIKLGKLLENESIILKATINKGLETSIRGTLDNTTKSVTFLGDFKTNEYVRLINTSTSVVLVRLIDSFNLQSAVTDLGFLMQASQTEENQGTISDKATTPLSNKTVFTRRVNGDDSGDYLASTVRNGLLSKEDKEIIDDLAGGTTNSNKYGTVLIGDVGSGSPGFNYPVTGDIQSCSISQNTGNGRVATVTLSAAMSSSDYFVRQHIESVGNIEADNDLKVMVFKKISTTQFQIYTEETGGVTQNIRLHIEIIQA